MDRRCGPGLSHAIAGRYQVIKGRLRGQAHKVRLDRNHARYRRDKPGNWVTATATRRLAVRAMP